MPSLPNSVSSTDVGVTQLQPAFLERLPKDQRKAGGGMRQSSAAEEAEENARQREFDALAKHAMEDAAASGGGGLGKLIGSFLVCYVCCGMSCLGGALALVVLGLNRLKDDGPPPPAPPPCADDADWVDAIHDAPCAALAQGMPRDGANAEGVATCDACPVSCGTGCARSAPSAGAAAADAPGGNGLQLLILGAVPIFLLAVCVAYLRVQDGGCCRPEYISPNGLAAKRKQAMQKRQGLHDDEDDDEEAAREMALGDASIGPVGSNCPPPAVPATMRISVQDAAADVDVSIDEDLGAGGGRRAP